MFRIAGTGACLPKDEIINCNLERAHERPAPTGTAASSISTGTNAMPSRLGNTRMPCRAMRRQSDTVLGIRS